MVIVVTTVEQLEFLDMLEDATPVDSRQIPLPEFVDPDEEDQEPF